MILLLQIRDFGTQLLNRAYSTLNSPLLNCSMELNFQSLKIKMRPEKLIQPMVGHGYIVAAAAAACLPWPPYIHEQLHLKFRARNCA